MAKTLVFLVSYYYTSISIYILICTSSSLKKKGNLYYISL